MVTDVSRVYSFEDSANSREDGSQKASDVDKLLNERIAALEVQYEVETSRLRAEIEERDARIAVCEHLSSKQEEFKMLLTEKVRELVQAKSGDDELV